MIDSPIRIVALCGSMRADGLTRQALEVTLRPLRAEPDVLVDVIEPGSLPLAVPGAPGARELESLLLARVLPADGVVLATPEYNGSYSSTIKILLDNLGYPSALEHKPVALIGVASGAHGAVKALDHLRSVCGHVGAWALPYAVSVPCAPQVFSAEGCCQDAALEELLTAAGVRLLHAIRRLRHEDAPVA